MQFKMQCNSKGGMRNDNFWHNTALQRGCNIVSNGGGIVSILLGFVVVKIVLANCPL